MDGILRLAGAKVERWALGHVGLPDIALPSPRGMIFIVSTHHTNCITLFASCVRYCSAKESSQPHLLSTSPGQTDQGSDIHVSSIDLFCNLVIPISNREELLMSCDEM